MVALPSAKAGQKAAVRQGLPNISFVNGNFVPQKDTSEGVRFQNISCGDQTVSPVSQSHCVAESWLKSDKEFLFAS